MTLQREMLQTKLEDQLKAVVDNKYGKSIADCSDQELYYAILELTKGLLDATEEIHGPKKVYYISAEFLLGKLLSNTLIHLGIYAKLDEILAAVIKD